ncbi:MAG TPA: GNAT family N-acetyltransferase [Ktedonobacteraceae bacterium]|nr:GNAT family N-acetyltransferase [Ktedonobacteraceae bacterium]
MIHPVLKDFSASSLVNAMEINTHAAWIHFAHGLGAQVYEEPHLLWFFSGLPFHLANGIVNARFPEDRLEEILGAHLREFSTKQVPMAWLIGPSTRPVDLGRHLQARGWMLGDEAPGMAIELQALDEAVFLPPSLTIERIHDAEALRIWLRIMTAGSDIPQEGLALLLELVSRHGFTDDPSAHYYLGLLADQPVATSLLYLAGGVAGIYNVATLPEVRHQGIGSALTVAPLLQARTWGYHIGTLQSSPMGLHLYRRLGFQEYCTFQAYFWQGTTE